MLKQMLVAGTIDERQIDACRLGGVNEVLVVLLTAQKSGLLISPHLSTIDYVVVAGENSLEFVDRLHEHFVSPAVIMDGYYYTTPHTAQLQRRDEEELQRVWMSAGQVLGERTGPIDHGAPQEETAQRGGGHVRDEQRSLDRSQQLGQVMYNAFPASCAVRLIPLAQELIHGPADLALAGELLPDRAALIQHRAGASLLNRRADGSLRCVARQLRSNYLQGERGGYIQMPSRRPPRM